MEISGTGSKRAQSGVKTPTGSGVQIDENISENKGAQGEVSSANGGTESRRVEDEDLAARGTRSKKVVGKIQERVIHAVEISGSVESTKVVREEVTTTIEEMASSKKVMSSKVEEGGTVGVLVGFEDGSRKGVSSSMDVVVETVEKTKEESGGVVGIEVDLEHSSKEEMKKKAKRDKIRVEQEKQDKSNGCNCILCMCVRVYVCMFFVRSLFRKS